MDKILACYRFVGEGLTSEKGDASWRVGEWNTLDGEVVWGSKGFHAALTPRDSLKNLQGQRWFLAEARGEIIECDRVLVASEMRLVAEIPQTVLQRFAVWCAGDCLNYYEDACPDGGSIPAGDPRDPVNQALSPASSPIPTG